MKTLKEILGGIHWHFKVIAFDRMAEDGKCFNATELFISEAETEEEAIAIAKGKVKKPQYMLREAWQCTNCGKQDEMINLLRRIHRND